MNEIKHKLRLSRYTIVHPKSPWAVERFGVVLER